MQDPESSRPENGKKQPSTQQPPTQGESLPNTQLPSITLDEETLATELLANTAETLLLKTAVQQIGEQIKKALGQGGNIEIRKEDGVTIIIITSNTEILRVIASGNKIRTAHTDKKTQPDGPFGSGIHRGKLLDKARIAWLREWPRDMNIFHNNKRGSELKIIIAENKNITPPKGWTSSPKPVITTVKNGTRLRIPTIFSKGNDEENTPPKKVDIYCHEGFIVIVPAGQPDLSQEEMLDTGIPQK